MTEQTTALITGRIASKDALAKIERVVIEGDLSRLSDGERIAYYARVCESLGLNPLTRPFDYINLNGKLTLYARKDSTDQLRSVNNVSVERIEREHDADLGLMTITAYGRDRHGRTDSATGVVSVKGLSGVDLANAMMKAETKAKRRMTLSLVGLGWLDESEIADAGAVPVSVDPVTGAIETTEGERRTASTRQRIAERTAAMRGERIDTGESEAGVSEGGAEPVATSTEGVTTGGSPVYSGDVLDVDDIPFDAPPGDKGDPWMRRLHAIGAERGMDHDALHEYAAQHFGVDSLSHLDASERAELVDRIDALSQSEAPPVDARPPAAQSTPDDAAGVVSGGDPATAADSDDEGAPPATSPDQPPALPTDPDTMRTFAAAVLDLKTDDVWGLGDLDQTDWERVWDALSMPAGEKYAMWYGRLDRKMRTALMAAKQSPRLRQEWADAGQAVPA